MRILISLCTTGAAVLLLSGCGNKTENSNPTPAVELPPGVFVNEAPAGTPTPIPEARTQVNPGDDVLFEGRVLGVVKPFVENRAVFVLGDEASITSCDKMAEDHCKTPWDACCDPADVRQNGTATIQVVSDTGEVIKRGLRDVNGLRELSQVRVAGVVAKQSSPESLIVNATHIYVAPPTP